MRRGITLTLCIFLVSGSGVPWAGGNVAAQGGPGPNWAGHSVRKIVKWGPCNDAVFQRPDGRLWIGGADTSCPIEILDLRSSRQIAFARYASTGQPGLLEHRDPGVPMGISSIAESKADGKVWFCSSYYRSGPGISAARYLSWYDGKRWGIKLLDACPSTECTAGVFQGPGGSLWSWSQGLLRKYSDGAWSAPTVLWEELAGQHPPPPSPVEPITIKVEIPMLDDSPFPRPTSVAPAAPLSSGGRDTGNTSYGRDLDHTIVAAIGDREGDVWLATKSAVVVYDEKTHKFTIVSYREGIGAEIIYEDNSGDLWFGHGFGATVERFERRSGSWTAYNLLDHITDPKEYLIESGLIAGSPTNARPDLPIEQARGLLLLARLTSICQDSHGTLLFGLSGGPGGLVALDSHNQWSRYGFQDLGVDFTDIEAIIRTHDGTLMVSTDSALLALDP
jgi:hypothetical protein